MILLEQFLEMLAALGVDTPLLFGDHPAPCEVLVNLAVQLLAVGDDDEGPVSRQLAQHLLGEKVV